MKAALKCGFGFCQQISLFLQLLDFPVEKVVGFGQLEVEGNALLGQLLVGLEEFEAIDGAADCGRHFLADPGFCDEAIDLPLVHRPQYCLQGRHSSHDDS